MNVITRKGEVIQVGSDNPYTIKHDRTIGTYFVFVDVYHTPLSWFGTLEEAVAFIEKIHQAENSGREQFNIIEEEW